MYMHYMSYNDCQAAVLYCYITLKNEFNNKINKVSSVMIAFYHSMYAVRICIISRKVIVH